MEQIVIWVKDRQKAKALLNFLKSLDFVENVTTGESSRSEVEGEAKDNTAEFFSMAGLWSRREITLKDIRQKAWPARL